MPVQLAPGTKPAAESALGAAGEADSGGAGAAVVPTAAAPRGALKKSTSPSAGEPTRRPKAFAEVVKRGWCIKEGSVVKSWRKRWFVLRVKMSKEYKNYPEITHVLTYFRTVEQSANGLFPTGAIPLSSETTMVEIVERFGKKCLRIETPKYQRVLYFQPLERKADVESSEVALSEWSEVLQTFETPTGFNRLRRDTLGRRPPTENAALIDDDDDFDDDDGADEPDPGEAADANTDQRRPTYDYASSSPVVDYAESACASGSPREPSVGLRGPGGAASVAAATTADGPEVDTGGPGATESAADPEAT
eukprot:m.46985 g.46985  ORF g.46985 m.46985 type:complete len:307 (-) comp8816_c0_seq1:1531-2451(-)